MITVSHLTKTFRMAVPKEGRFAAFRSLFYREYTAKRAVDDVSFTVGDGEIVGYIGPNACGQTWQRHCSMTLSCCSWMSQLLVSMW